MRATYTWIDGKMICKSRDGELTAEYLSAYQGPPAASAMSGFGSDTLGNDVNGVLNHADGKRYDSKSAYNRAVVAAGCRVVGNDLNNTQYKTPMERGLRGDFKVAPALREALQKVRG